MLTNCLKHYPFSLLILLIVILLSVCPIGAPELAKDVPLADKWTHMVMYFAVAVIIGWEYSRAHRPDVPLCGLLFWGLLFPTLLGGILELVQAYCTNYRSGEWLDLAADSLGAVVGAALFVLPEMRKHYLR